MTGQRNTKQPKAEIGSARHHVAINTLTASYFASPPAGKTPHVKIALNEYGDLLPHDFTAEQAEEKYLKSAATCTEKAVYYKSCTVCGEKGTETFEYGNPLGHDYGAWTSNDNGTHTRVCSRDANHTETDDCHGGTASCTKKAVCEDCKAEYGDLLPHDFTAEQAEEKYLKSAATCTEKAVYYKSCTVCGEKGTETFEYGNPLGHDYGAWTSNGDGTHTRV